jgi:type VI secretion system secreted protein VgrG
MIARHKLNATYLLPRTTTIQGATMFNLSNETHFSPLPANKTRTVFMRIEDKKGAEQIFLHAQRDWNKNIEHDQQIRVGNERHDTVEQNTCTELKAEEHRITHADRKVEVRMDDHLTIAKNQHIKVGTAQLVSAGNEIHLKAGEKIVIDAEMELTVKAGGSFIKVDVGGIAVMGPEVKVNAGGSPGNGTGIGIKSPMLPGAADRDQAGSLMARALGNAGGEKTKSKPKRKAHFSG